MVLINITLKAEELGKSLEGIEDSLRVELQDAIKSMSKMVYNEGLNLAQQRLQTTRQDYIRNFNYENLGNNMYIIYLNNEVNYLEDGFSSFDMKPGFLNGPKAKVTPKGTRYNTIPFTHHPYSETELKPEQMQLRQNLRDVIKSHNLGRIIKDGAGKPLQGVVARLSGKDLAQNLQGLVKIQKTYEKKTESYYMTFRRVSDNTDASKWIHPGYKGANIFPDLERWTDVQIERILNEILK